jgi:hypothetical protein
MIGAAKAIALGGGAHAQQPAKEDPKRSFPATLLIRALVGEPDIDRTVGAEIRQSLSSALRF